MLKVKEIKPIGCQVLVTKNLYDKDDYNEHGILIHQKGDIRQYQTVVAVGDDVKFVKPGDVVFVNYYKYAVFKEDPNSVKAMADNPIVGFRLHEVELSKAESTETCILIDQRDIHYIIVDFEEKTYSKAKLDDGKQSLILPSSSFKA